MNILRLREEMLFIDLKSEPSNGKVSRNTLANANQVRDWHIYADFAQVLIATARSLYANDKFGVEL